MSEERYWFYVVGIKGDMKFLAQSFNLVRKPGCEQASRSPVGVHFNDF